MKVMFNLFIFLSIVVSLFSLILSYEMYSFTNNGISAHASGNGEVNLTVEGANTICGDALCNGVETCSTCASDCGACSTAGTGGSSGSSGGGGSSASNPRFELSENSLTINSVSGTSNSEQFVIKNTGTVSLILKITTTGITNYLDSISKEIVLAPGESFPLTFTLNAPEPGVYAGKITVQFGNVKREVIILYNVVSEGVLFDATITIPDLYRVLRAGQRLPTLIELTEVGNEGGVDVTMNYVLKDFDGRTHYTESETFYVQGTKSYSKRFSTTGLEPGDYVLGVELVYPGGFATSSAHFKISSSVMTPQTWISLISGFVALIVVILSVVFFVRKNKNNSNNVKGAKNA